MGMELVEDTLATLDHTPFLQDTPLDTIQAMLAIQHTQPVTMEGTTILVTTMEVTMEAILAGILEVTMESLPEILEVTLVDTFILATLQIPMEDCVSPHIMDIKN